MSGNSDFLTFHNVFASWRKASENPNFIRTYCKRNFLSHQVSGLRLLAWLVDGLEPSTSGRTSPAAPVVRHFSFNAKLTVRYLVDSAFVPGSDGLRKELNQ